MSSAHASAQASASAGFPIVGLLGVSFVVLKLTGHIAWPWLWVLAPFWIPASFVILALVVSLLLVIVGAALKTKRR